MADKSKIEWTDASWTPIRARNLKTGKIGWHCEHATTGCEFCYAETLNKRLGTGLPFKPGHRSDIEIFLDPQMLLAPLKWKKPRMIFVYSMTDMFADFVPDEWIDQVFAVMALCPQHTFQVLTKRAERMRDYVLGMSNRHTPDGNMQISPQVVLTEIAMRGGMLRNPATDAMWMLMDRWPLENVWLGVSTERQKEADERIPLLLQTPAAVRFISAEPLLGPIDLSQYLLTTFDVVPEHLVGYPNAGRIAPLDWVITGGESGRNARPSHPDWFRQIRDACTAAGVAYFHKQNGEFAVDPDSVLVEADGSGAPNIAWPDGTIAWGKSSERGGYGTRLLRVGKKAAGRLLDGKTHDAMPSPPDHVIKPPARRVGGE